MNVKRNQRASPAHRGWSRFDGIGLFIASCATLARHLGEHIVPRFLLFAMALLAHQKLPRAHAIPVPAMSRKGQAKKHGDEEDDQAQHGARNAHCPFRFHPISIGAKFVAVPRKLWRRPRFSAPILERIAAVADEAGAGDEAAILGKQEGDLGGDLFGPGEASGGAGGRTH
jgi:hypothetical protein